jgi:hypothetical protein
MIFFGCVPQLSHSKSPGGLVIGIGRDLYILYYPIYINLLGIMIASDDHRMTLAAADQSCRRSGAWNSWTNQGSLGPTTRSRAMGPWPWELP